MGVSMVLFLLGSVLLAEVYTQHIFKVCSTDKDIPNCKQMERDGEVACISNLHNIDCVLNIDQGKTDFGRLKAEEALIAANYVNNTVVIGEFTIDGTTDNSEYATVVLVRANYTGGLKGFKGMKYCHPGFKFDEIITELALKEFENAILKENNAEGCSNKVSSNTLFEKELKALSDFFGPSCRPGPWIGLEQYDNEFYNRYPRLCELCTSNTKCTVPAGVVPFMHSLECLVNSKGDVTLTTINTVYEYFNKTENQYKKSDYKYFCRNGETNNLDNPCVWSRQPSHLILANIKEAESIKNKLQNWLPNYITPVGLSSSQAKFEEKLKLILFPEDKQYQKIKLTSQTQSLKDYIKGYREIPNPNNKKCNQDVKWCTISHHEQEKCKWLAQASINRAIQPSLECVPSTSKFSCLEDIKAGKADVVTSGAHYGYIARKKNLAPLAYPDTGMRYYIKPIVVIKTSNELNIQKFENLKNRKACLPEYAGIEWLSFINVVRDHKLFPNVTCDYGKLISDFVGDSCMPGAHDSEHEKSNQTNEDKLCGLCIPDINKSKTAKTCNADDTNKYYGDEGALKCLKEVGDFAVITKQVYKGINASEFKVLCKNGSLALTPGFDVDDNCVLTNIIDSEVVAKRNTTKFEDIAIVLFNFETRFGIDKAFQVFAEFNNTLNLLFKDSTFGLTTTNEVKPAVKNYNELFAHTDSCVENSPGAAAGVTVIPALITFASMFLILREF